tara:strand:- start:68 stop:787 length:720 start_codon:yes stop_codon:yes gene_type:complete
MNVLTEFSLKKKSETENLNQDAYSINLNNGTFAIADGVSTAPFSEIWSQLIVTKFVKNPPDTNDSILISSWLDDIRKEWFSEIKKNESVDDLVREVAEEEGSATTFLGGKFEKINKRKKLDVFAIGDSNIFILRKNRIIDSFPIELSGTFSDRTNAISSIKNIGKKETFSTKTFNLLKNDIIILATDALAKWILNSSNLGQKPWNKILKNKNSIEKYIEELRAKNKIDDDDTTCMILQI